MGSNEEYLDSLLRQVNGEAASSETELEGVSGQQAEEAGTGEAGEESARLLFDEDEVEFPELAKLFEEEDEDDIDSQTAEQISVPDPEPEMADDVFSEESGPEAEMVKQPDPVEETPDLEELHNMDLSDLEAMMEPDPFESGNEGDRQELNLLEDADVTDLIDAMDDDDELAEISELLKKADSNEAIVDSGSVANAEESAGLQEEETEPAAGSVSDGFAAEEDVPGEKRRQRKEKKKREKKERSDKGPGFFQKVVAFFMDDDVPEEEEDDEVQVDLSQENIAILEELDKGTGAAGKEKKAAKPKKEKKPKQKKEKKPKPKKEKKPKPKKEKKPKPKKEKKPKEPEKPLKPIGKKKIFTAVLLALTVYGIIMICTSYIPDFTDRQNSKKAFEEGDYKRVYDLLVTKELKGRDEERLRGAMLCLEMERKLESYENFGKLDGMEVEQLHALVSGVDKYQKIQAEAEKYGVAAQVNDSYLNILAILQSEYGIAEEEAQAIASLTDKVSYTKELKRILGMEITAVTPEEE